MKETHSYEFLRKSKFSKCQRILLTKSPNFVEKKLLKLLIMLICVRFYLIYANIREVPKKF